MNAVLDNLRATGPDFERAYAAQYEVSSGQAEYEAARTRFLRSLDLDDITNEFDDVSLALFCGDDANAIGRHVISLRNAWADRLARREVYGSKA